MTGVQTCALPIYRKEILAFTGEGSAHHKAGEPFQTFCVRHVLQTGEICLVNTRELLGCPNEKCKLTGGIVVPLQIKDETIGSLGIFKTQNDAVNEEEQKLAEGVANLLNMQLEIALLNEESKLLSRAKFAALKAQLNPHFLFNSLSAIMSCCRSDPEEARELIIHLSKLLRRRLKEGDDLILLSDELEAVSAYLAITKVRLGEKLRVDMQIQEGSPECVEIGRAHV